MTPEDWKRVRAVFDAAVEQPAEERPAFVSQACAGDDSLRLAVEALLRADEHGQDLLEQPAWAERPTDGRPDVLVGCRLGDYELVGVVGQGGMGVVYQATRADDQFRKQVAVKLIRRGMDSAFVLERFRYEREILASLDHPNIARLLDAGTAPDGRPYLVMDYVDGQPIHRYCAERGLAVRQRLHLFRQVCGAVAYAHQNLVVHRDLKPGNILIAKDGTPKLLDFGIAKLLDPSDARESTATGLLLATPEYASPEQVRGERITTASDVYSLGVVLYELLTGRKPYALATRHPQELVEVICLREPERPSLAVTRDTPDDRDRRPNGSPRELRRALSGDLDNVVLMALRKEPQRRYASVEQLSDDLGRHLELRPVRARPDTFWYRTGRLVGRHRLATAFLILLVGWLSTASYQARVAQAERARAQRRFGDVRKLATSFLFDFHEAIRELPGSTKAREMVVKKAVEYLDGLAREAAGDPGLQRELGLAYVQLAQVQGGIGDASLGDQRGAVRHLETAVALLGQALAARPDPALAGELADTHKLLATNLSWQLRFDDASRHLQEARRLAARASGAFGRVEDVLREVSIEQLEADWFAGRGTWGEDVARLRAGLALLRSLPPEAGADPKVRWRRLTLQVRLCDALGQLGRPDDSLTVLAELTGDLEVRGEPQKLAERRMLALAHIMASNALVDLERPAEAAKRLARALEIVEWLHHADPANFQPRRDTILIQGFLCTAESHSGRKLPAREACASALGQAEVLAREHPAEPGVLDSLAMACERNARLARAEGRFAEAMAFSRRMMAALPRNSDAFSLCSLASGHAGLAEALAGLGHTAEAQVEARRGLQLLEQARVAAPQEPSVLKDLASAQASLGRLLTRRRSEPAEARGLLQSALATFDGLVREGMTLPQVRREIQRLHRDLAGS